MMNYPPEKMENRIEWLNERFMNGIMVELKAQIVFGLLDLHHAPMDKAKYYKFTITVESSDKREDILNEYYGDKIDE